MCLEIWTDYVEFLMLLTSLDRSGNSGAGAGLDETRGVNAEEREEEERMQKEWGEKLGNIKALISVMCASL